MTALNMKIHRKKIYISHTIHAYSYKYFTYKMMNDY